MHQVEGRVKIAADNHVTPALRVPASGVPVLENRSLSIWKRGSQLQMHFWRTTGDGSPTRPASTSNSVAFPVATEWILADSYEAWNRPSNLARPEDGKM